MDTVLIQLIVIDLAALLLAPKMKALLALVELEKDGIQLICYGDLPKQHVKHALKQAGLLQYFDSLLYEELMPELTSNELRMLAAASTLWLRQPEDVDYTRLVLLLPKRKRLLSKALRLAKLSKLDASGDTYSLEDDNGIQEQAGE